MTDVTNPQPVVVLGMSSNTAKRIIKALKKLPMEEAEELVEEIMNLPQLNVTPPAEPNMDGDQ